MIKGSCLCHKITYIITGEIGEIIHCHCETCRKAHGAAFSSVASVKDDDFKVSGEEWLSSFESSAGKQRYFCRQCGTQIYAKRDGTEHIILRLGSLDDDPSSHDGGHIWLEDKASWYDLDANTPRRNRGS